MVKGTTKSGIKFQIDERVKDDTRLLQYIVEMQDTENQMKQSTAMFDLLGLLFGGRSGVVAFQNAVASTHDGVCTSEVMLKELTEIFEKINLKKS